MAFDQEQYPYSPIPYQDEGGNDPLDRWLQVFNDQANKLVANGKDPQKVQAALQQKQAALTAAYNYYGPDIFKPKPSGSELDASRNAYNLPTYTPQVEDSPLQEDRPVSPDFSNVKSGTIQDKNGIASPSFGDLISEGNQTITEAEKPIADTALGLGNFAMLGPIAGGITGLGKLADTGDLDQAADVANKVSEKLTYQPKTEGGKKILGAINKPFELWNDAGDWIGDKYYDLTGSPSVAAITSSVFKISPFLLGGGKLTSEKPFVKGERLSPDVQEAAVPDPTKVDFGRQQDLFDTPEQNATEGVRDMFSGEMTPASTAEQRRVLAADANKAGSEVPQRSPEEQVALERDYGFQQAERPQPQPPAEEPPAQAEMWNFGAQGDTQMAEAFRQAQLARGTDLTGQNRFPRTRGEADVSQGPNRNYPLNEVAQEELPLQGGQGDLFPKEAPQPIQQATPQAAVIPQAPTVEIPKTDNPLFGSTEGINRASGARLAGTVWNALDNGELTGQHVLDAIADNHENIYGNNSKSNIALAFADSLRKKAERFGGLDTKINIIDEQAHADVLARMDAGKNKGRWKKAAGFYDPSTDQIYINGERNLRPSTLVHEIAHAVSFKAIQAGIDGELVGAPRQAFATYQNLFDSLSARPDTSYGFTDLHEFTSELYGKPEFREHLKTLDINAVQQAKLGMPRSTWGKISNMYQAVVKSLNGVLGNSPKMENGLDAAIAAHESFFNSFSDKDIKALSRQEGAHETPRAGSVDDTFNSRRQSQLGKEETDKINEHKRTVQQRWADRTANYVRNKVPDSFLGKRYAELSNKEFDDLHSGLIKEWRDVPEGSIQAEARPDLKEKIDAAATERWRRISLTGKSMEDLVSQYPDMSFEHLQGGHGSIRLSDPEGKFAPQQTVGPPEPPIFERGLKAKDAIRSIESQKRGNSLLGAGVALVNSREGRAAAMKESAPNAAITAYYEGKDPNALANFPETKAAIDKDKGRNTSLSIGLAQATRSIPNQTAKIANMANAFVQNAGKYLAEIYHGSDYAKEAYDTAGKAEKAQAAGKTLDEKQTAALGLVQGVRQWAREHIVPGSDLSKKTIDTLHDMGELVGVDTKNVMDQVERNSGLKGRDLKDAQRAAVEDAIKKATPNGAKLDRLVDQAVRILGGFDKSGGRLGRYVEGARLGDIFTEKSHVPEPIAKYIGRVDDVFSRIVATGEKQARGLADLQAQGRLKEALNGRGLWETAAESPSGSLELKGKDFGPLEGHYASPEIHALLTDSKATHNMIDNLFDALLHPTSELGKAWQKGIWGFKTGRLATGAQNHVMYAMGALSKLIAGGFNFSPKNMFDGIRGAYHEMGSYKDSALERELVRNDLLDLNAQNQLRTQIRNAKYDMKGDPIADALSSVTSDNVKAWAHKPTTFLNVMDSWSTTANYLQRKAELTKQYERQGIEKSTREIEREAANDTKQTNTTPERGIRVGRVLEKNGGSIGLSYAIELHRNVANSFLLGMKDVARGAKANDPLTVGVGLKRIAGVGTAVLAGNALFNAIGGVGTSLLGVQSKEIPWEDPRTPYIQDEGSRFRAGKPSELVGGAADADPKNSYLADWGGAWDQFYAVSQPLAILGDIAQHHNDPDFDLKKQMSRLMDNYTAIIFANPVTKTMLKAVEGKAPSWAYRDADGYAKAKAALVNTQLMSGQTADRWLNMADLFMPGFLKNYQSSKDLPPEMQAIFQLGYGVTKVPKNPMEGPEANKFKTAVMDARSPLRSMIEDDSDYSEKAMEGQYVRSLKGVNDALQHVKDITAFAKGSGVDESEVQRAMALKSISGDVTGSLGEETPARVLYMNLYMSFMDKLGLADEDKQEAMSERFKNKMQSLQDLTEKYMDLTPEQIKDL